MLRKGLLDIQRIHHRQCTIEPHQILQFAHVLQQIQRVGKSRGFHDDGIGAKRRQHPPDRLVEAAGKTAADAARVDFRDRVVKKLAVQPHRADLILNDGHKTALPALVFNEMLQKTGFP